MIRTEQLTKVYTTGGNSHRVLDGVGLDIGPGTIGAVVGRSGAGKSTLARCVNLLERPTGGRVHIAGTDVTDLPEAELRHARRAIGTVFQSANLLARRTAAENVALPLRYLGVTARQERARVAELLERVGLADKAGHHPRRLSGGQRQRVGIARALALRPKVLLADEATSGLDPGTTKSVLGLLRELSDDLGLSVLLITHEMEVVREIADTAVLLREGRVAESGAVPELVADPRSELGNALLPDRPRTGETAGLSVWRVTYRGGRVPLDWLSRLGAEHGLSVEVLSATIEGIAGRAAGRAVVAVPRHQAHTLVRTLDAWGIGAEEVQAPADTQAATETTPGDAADGPLGPVAGASAGQVAGRTA